MNVIFKDSYFILKQIQSSGKNIPGTSRSILQHKTILSKADVILRKLINLQMKPYNSNEWDRYEDYNVATKNTSIGLLWRALHVSIKQNR